MSGVQEREPQNLPSAGKTLIFLPDIFYKTNRLHSKVGSKRSALGTQCEGH